MPCSKEEFLWNVHFHPWSGSFLPSPGCSSQRMDSKYMAVAPEFGYRVLQYLCENGVQPEIWQDVVAELDTAQQTEQEGGAWRGQ